MIAGLTKKTVSDVDISGKKVFLRVDFNVPIDPDGNILDDTRIAAHLETINYVLSKGAKLIVASHFGRPKGKVKFVNSCVGAEVESAVAELKEGELLLLENVRFDPGETANSPELAKRLAVLCDVYVDDAFSAAHRAHASVAEIAKYVPVSVQGFLMEKEIFNLGKLVETPQQPFVLVLGGAKVKDKIWRAWPTCSMRPNRWEPESFSQSMWSWPRSLRTTPKQRQFRPIRYRTVRRGLTLGRKRPTYLAP